MNSFLSYWSCGLFFMCSCISFVPDRACLYCLSYQLPFFICLSFQKKTFSFVVESVLFFSIHAFTNQTAGALDHTFSSLNILLIFYRKYLLGLENTFDPFQLISQWLFKENFILGCINSTKPMAQALLYSKNEKTQASKFRILLMNSINSVNSL